MKSEYIMPRLKAFGGFKGERVSAVERAAEKREPRDSQEIINVCLQCSENACIGKTDNCRHIKVAKEAMRGKG